MKPIILLLLSLVSLPCLAGNLEIRWKNYSRVWTTETILNHPNRVTITIEKDPAYDHTKQTYQAIPIHALFAEHPKPSELLQSIVQFYCLDGFSAPMRASRLLPQDPNESQAYLAVDSRPKVGPFYLVWKNPERSQIGPEEWPFQLKAFEVKESLTKTFPKIIPEPEFSAGFELFQKHCFACHTLNQQGFSQIGPDLNFPKSPTEYFNEQSLRSFIRNPSSLRHWPQSRMRGFSEKQISESELNALLAYFKHMASRRR